MRAYEIDEETGIALERISSKPTDAGRYVTPEIKSQLERLKLFPPRKVKQFKTHNPKTNVPPFRNVALFVTQNCNLNCSYCYGAGGSYGSPGHMARETALRAVDWLIGQSGEVKRLGVSFFGGEPLLNLRLIKEVIAYACTKGEEFSKSFEFSITTNASLLDRRTIAFLRDNNVKPVVSFDGCKQIQDEQRPFVGGRGSYEIIVPKIKELLRVFPDATARATLVGRTDPATVIAALHEIGFTSTHITFASASLFDALGDEAAENYESRSIAHMMEEEVAEIIDDIKNRYSSKLKERKSNSILVTRLGEFLNGQRRYFGCGAGRDYVGISNAGDIFLCHRFVGMSSYKLGNVHAPHLEKKSYLDSPIKNNHKCAACFAKYICGGGCYHENLGGRGSLFGGSQQHCALMRRSVELISFLSTQLSEDDKTYLVKAGIIARTPCPFDFPVRPS